PRAAPRLARRRPRPAEGGRSFLRFRRVRARTAPRPVPEPLGSLPPDRLPDVVNVRPATAADRDAIHELWQEFVKEVPEPAGFAPDNWESDWAEIERNMKDGAVFVAEDAGAVVGFLEASAAEPERWHVETVHVRPAHRREGVAKEMLRACAASVRAAGAAYVS